LRSRQREPNNTPSVSGQEAPGAVVIGGDYQGLGIARSLGRRGVRVCVIDDEYSITRFSKYCVHSLKVSSLRTHDDIRGSLLDLKDRFDVSGWVLFPTREEIVAAISESRQELSLHYRVPTSDWSRIRWAWDKRNTYQLAEELGIPMPATFYPKSVSELSGVPNLRFPVALKPAIKEHFVYATRAKAWAARNHAELKSLCQKAFDIVGPGEVMIQEFIPGGGLQQFAYCAFFRDQEAIGKMVVRRRRQHPYQFGRASTFVETVDVPVVEDYSERFLRAIDYYGLVEIEYKLDPRDNQYKLLDVNPRTWGYHSIGLQAGVDFPYLQYADQVGLPVTRCEARQGIGWVRMITDIPAALMASLAGDLDFRGYVQSLSTVHADAVFSWDDPLPGIGEVFMLPYLLVKRGF
jgi:D-aspartate ligase